MDFQLLYEWWPWSRFSCEICCRELWENRNQSGDSFQWTALNTRWIFQWRPLIASGVFCGGGRERERKREKDERREPAIGVMQSLSSFTKASLPLLHGLPPSYLSSLLYFVWLFNFQRPAGAKRLALRGLYIFKIPSPGLRGRHGRGLRWAGSQTRNMKDPWAGWHRRLKTTQSKGFCRAEFHLTGWRAWDGCYISFILR